MQKDQYSFELITQNNDARLGKFQLQEATLIHQHLCQLELKELLKECLQMILKKTGSQIILGNTYHLLLRPGIQILDKFKGLHNFMNWQNQY